MSPSLDDISIGPELTSEQARAIFGQGEEAVVFALLELRKQLAEAQEEGIKGRVSTFDIQQH